MMSSQETLRQVFPDKATPLVSYGIPFTEACTKHVSSTFNASGTYLIALTSLTKITTHTSALQKALGSKIIKTRVGMTPHTLMSKVLEIIEDCRSLSVDCIVTLCGSSLSDGAKITSFVRLLYFPSPPSTRQTPPGLANQVRTHQPPRTAVKDSGNLHPDHAFRRRVLRLRRRHKRCHRREDPVLTPARLTFSHHLVRRTSDVNAAVDMVAIWDARWRG
jgi:hypothetical protein